MTPAFQAALDLHRTGRVPEAEAAYRAILAAQPQDAAALHHLGLLLTQTGRLDEALAALSQALAADPNSAEVHAARGTVLFGLQRLDEAAEAFGRASELNPENLEVLLNYGTALQEMGRFEDALSACDRALAVAPGHPGALNNRGNALRALGHLEGALVAFEQAIAAAPEYGLAHFNRATVLEELKRHDEALAECNLLAARAPQYAPAQHLRGTIFLALQRHEDALTAFERALSLQPDMMEAWHGRTDALIKLTRWEEALAACEIAAARDPGSAIAHNNRGVALLKLRRCDEARAEFEQAIALEPKNARSYFNRSGLNYQENRLEEALADTQTAFELDPAFAAARCFRFSLAAHLCVWRERAGDVEAILRHIHAGEEIDPFPLLYAADDPEQHLIAARRAAGKTKQAVTRTKVMARKTLRIAYLSADFREHPVSHQAAELFESHDAERVETYAISLWPQPEGPVSARMRKAFTHFVEAFDRSDYDIARRIADLQIDIAVDLGGYSDKARPQILAHRPAPVTATYLGYPGSTGAPYIDYIIADALTIPAEDDRFYAESVARLPLCFMPFDSTTRPSGSPSRADEGLPENAIVFANFNKTDKITPEIFAAWMRILAAVPGSVLWLAAANVTAQNNLKREAAARGVAPERLIFSARRAGRAEHLARLALADLFLDTSPYNAHATASDFLSAGVPVLTLAGRSFASRVAASLLHAVDLPELITTSAAEYEMLALALANDPARLQQLRAKMKPRVAADSKRLARALEDAYFAMWERRVRGEKPASFDVLGR